MPFIHQADAAGERTDGPGPPRRGWLGRAGNSMDAPRGRLAGVVWFLSRQGRYGRAVMLHEHVRERWGARRAPGPGPRPRGLAACARRLDGEAAGRLTVWAAMRWAALTRRLSSDRPGREAVVGAVAAPLAAPAVVVGAAALGALVVVGLGLRALSTVGGSVRRSFQGAFAPAGGDAGDRPAPRPFDWTPSAPGPAQWPPHACSGARSVKSVRST